MKRLVKKKSQSSVVSRKVVGPDVLNPNGTLYGGEIMSWIDEIAFMCARRHAGVPFVVTASIDNITFLAPIHLGQHVLLSASVNLVGRSSMEIGVRVDIEDPDSAEVRHANSAYATFVALDRQGVPTTVPEVLLETLEDHRRAEEAQLRVKVRARLKRRMERKLSEADRCETPAHDHALGLELGR